MYDKWYPMGHEIIIIGPDAKAHLDWTKFLSISELRTFGQILQNEI